MTVSAQPQPKRCRVNDGAGKSETSWEKHVLMAKALAAQAAKAAEAFRRGRGVIVDMHAHDGGQVDSSQRSLFEDPSGTSSAVMALLTAQLHRCDLVLCESHRQRLHRLRLRINPLAAARGVPVRFLNNHHKLLDLDWSPWAWAIVLNDPNGPSAHGVDVMTHIASLPRLRSDFIVMVNEGALSRIHGVRPTVQQTDLVHANGAQIIALRRAKDVYAWMSDPQQWRERLGKRYVAQSVNVTNGKGYRGRLLLLSDSLANLNPEMFTWSN